MATYYNDVENGFHRNMRETNWQKLFPHWWDPNYLLKAIGDEVERIKAMYIFALLNSTIKPPVMLWKTDIDNKQYRSASSFTKLPSTIEIKAPLYETWGYISLMNKGSNDIYHLQIMITEKDGIEINDVIKTDDILKFNITNQTCHINKKKITFEKIGNGIPEFITSKNTEIYDPKNPLHNEILRIQLKSNTNQDVDIDVGVQLDHAVFTTEQNIEITGLEIIPIEKVDLYAYYDFPQNSKVTGWRKVYTKEYLKKTNVLHDMITTHFYTQKFYVEVFFKGLDYPYKIGFPCYKDAPEDSMYHVNTHLDQWSDYLGLKRRIYKDKIPPEDYPFTFPQFYPYDIEQDFWYYSRLINEYCWNDLAIDSVDILDTNGSSVMRLDCIDPFVQDFVVHAKSTAPTYIESTDFNSYRPVTVTQKSSANDSVNDIFVNPSTQGVMTPTSLSAEYKQSPFEDEENLLDLDEEAKIVLYKKNGIYISNEQYKSKELDLHFDLATLPNNIHITGMELSFITRSDNNSLNKFNDERTRFIVKNKSDIIYENPINTTDSYEINSKKIVYGDSKNNFGLKDSYVLKNETGKEVKTDIRDILVENGIHFIYALTNNDNNDTIIKIKNVELKIYYEPKKETFSLKTYIKKESDSNNKVGTLYIDIRNTGEKSLHTNIDIFSEDGISLSDNNFIVDLDIGSSQQHIVDIYPQYPIISKKYQILTTCEDKKRTDNIVLLQDGEISTSVDIHQYFIQYGQNFTLKANVHTYLNEKISEGSVRFYINGYYIGENIVQNGQSFLDVKFKDLVNKIDIGLLSLEARFSGSRKYQPSRRETTFLVSKKASSIKIKSSSVGVYNHNFLYEATVCDDKNHYLDSGKIAFYINDDHIGESEVVNGNVSFSLPLDTLPGEYILYAKYIGNINYSQSIDSIPFKIIGGETSVQVFDINGAYGDTVSLKAKVIDINSNKVPQGIVKFYIDKDFIGESTVSNDGLAKIDYTLSNVILDEYTTKEIYCEYEDETGTFMSSSNTGMLTISSIDVSISVNNVIASQRQSIGFYVKVEELVSHKPVVIGHVDLFYKGEIFASGSLNSDGYACVIYNPVYFSQSDFDRLNKFHFSVKENNLIYVYNDGVEEEVECVYDGDFSDLAIIDFCIKDGNLYVKNEHGEIDEQLFIDSDGCLYARPSKNKDIDDSVFGNLINVTYDIVYSSDKIFTQTTLYDNELVIRPSNVDINLLYYDIHYTSDCVFKAYVSLYDNANDVNVGTVSFYLDNVWIGDSDVVDGIATLPFNRIGNYSATRHLLQVEYDSNGNSNYMGCIASNFVDISKIPSVLSVDVDKIIQNEVSNIYVKVDIPKDSHDIVNIDGNVQLYLNNDLQTSYYLTSDENGECIISYQIPNNFTTTNNIIIKYAGNSYIQSSSYTIPIEQNLNNIEIQTNNQKAIQNKNITVTTYFLTKNNTIISDGTAELIDEYGNIIETSSVKNNKTTFNIETEKYNIGRHLFTVKYHNSTIFVAKNDGFFYLDIVPPNTDLYISKQGNDSNEGNIINPLKTLNQALQLSNDNTIIHITDQAIINDTISVNNIIQIKGFNDAEIIFEKNDIFIDHMLKQITVTDIDNTLNNLICLGSKYLLKNNLSNIVILNNNLYFNDSKEYIKLIIGSDNNIYTHTHIPFDTTEVYNNQIFINNKASFNNIKFKIFNDKKISIENTDNLTIYHCIIPKELTIYNNGYMKINQNLFYGQISNYINCNVDNNWWGSNKVENKNIKNIIQLKMKTIGSPVIGENIGIVAYLEGENGQEYDLPPLYVEFKADTGLLSINNGFLTNNHLQTLYTDSIKEGKVYCIADNEEVFINIFDYDRKTEIITEDIEAPLGYQIPLQVCVQSAGDLYYKFDKDNNLIKNTEAINNGYVKFFIDNEQIGKAKVKNGMGEINLFLSNKFTIGSKYKIIVVYESENYYFDSKDSFYIKVIDDQYSVYVSPDGSNTNDGSFDKPYQTIQQALKRDNINTIYLFDGVYKDTHITIEKDIIIKKYSGNVIFENASNPNIIIFNIMEKPKNSGLPYYCVVLDGLTFRNNNCRNLIFNYGYLKVVNCTFYQNSCPHSLIDITYGYGIIINYCAIVNNSLLFEDYHLITETVSINPDTGNPYIENENIQDKNLDYNWWGDNNPLEQDMLNTYHINNWLVMTIESSKDIIYIGSVAYITTKINSYLENGILYDIPNDVKIPTRIANFSSLIGSFMPLKDLLYHNKSTSLFNSNELSNSQQIILEITNNVNYVSQENIHIDCKVSDVYGNSVDDGVVSFLIEESEMLVQKNISVEGGIAHLTIPNQHYKIGEYDVHCVYINSNNEKYNTWGKVIIKKMDIVLKNVSIIGDDKLYNCDFYAEVYDVLGNPIYNNTINFMIDNEIIYNNESKSKTNNFLIKNGLINASLQYDMKEMGSHILNVKIPENDTYDAYDNNFHLNTYRKNTYIKPNINNIQKNVPFNFIVKVFDDNNNLVNSGDVYIKIAQQNALNDIAYEKTLTLVNGIGQIDNFTIKQEGMYSLIIYYKGDINYYKESNYIDNYINVDVYPVNLNSSVLQNQLSYKIGEKLNFNFPVTNQNNVMVDTGSVDLFLNNTKINDESIKVEHGFVIFEKELYDIEPGEYDFNIKYSDKSNTYAYTEFKTKLYIKKINNEIIIDTIKASPDTVIQLKYDIESEIGSVHTGILTAYYKDKQIGFTQLSNNVNNSIILNIPLLSETENHKITFYYEDTESNIYESTKKEVLLVIQKQSVNIQASPKWNYPNQPYTLTATIQDSEGDAINIGNVILYINNVEYETLNVINGVISYDVNYKSINDYQITLIYEENEYYKKTVYNHNMQIKNLPIKDIQLKNPIVTTSQSTITNELIFITENNYEVKDGIIDFYIEDYQIGSFFVTTDKAIKITLPKIKHGDHILKLHYHDSDIYSDKNVDIPIKITLTKVNVIINNNNNIVASIDDEIAIPLKFSQKINGLVRFYIGNGTNFKFIGVSMVSDDYYIYNYKLPYETQENQIIKVEFEGDDEHEPCEGEIPLEIIKTQASFVLQDVEGSYNSVINIPLVDVDIGINEMIQLYIKDNTQEIYIGDVILSNDTSYEYKLPLSLTPGLYTIIGRFNGNAVYNFYETQSNLVILPSHIILSYYQNNILSTNIAGEILLNSAITDENGNIVSDGKIQFSIDGEDIKLLNPNEEFKYKLNNNFTNDIVMQATYIPSTSLYIEETFDIPIEINKNTLNVTMEECSGYRGEFVDLIFNVTSIVDISLETNVKINIDGEFYNEKMHLGENKYHILLPNHNFKDKYVITLSSEETPYYSSIDEEFVVNILNHEVIYIAKDGSDTNIGSYEKPVSTLTKAIDLVGNNGTIKMLCDIDNENVNCDKNITIEANDKNITIKNTIINNQKQLLINNLVLENSQIYNYNELKLKDSIIKNTTNEYCIYNDNKICISHCTFDNNNTSNLIYATNKSTQTIIKQNHFSNNNSQKYGGCIYSNKGQNIIISDNTFKNNQATIDGNSITIASNAIIKNNNFENTTDNNNAEINILIGNVNIENNSFKTKKYCIKNLNGNVSANYNYWNSNNINTIQSKILGNIEIEEWLLCNYKINPINTKDNNFIKGHEYHIYPNINKYNSKTEPYINEYNITPPTTKFNFKATKENELNNTECYNNEYIIFTPSQNSSWCSILLDDEEIRIVFKEEE